MSGTSNRIKLGAVELNILEYVINFHARQINGKRSAFVALLTHASLLSRGAKLTTPADSNDLIASESILPANWASTDPIRLSYRLCRPIPGVSGGNSPTTHGNMLQVSIAETDNDIFVSLTDNTTEKFGHAEFSGPAHVRLDAVKGEDGAMLSVDSVFPQLEITLFDMEEKLWKQVLPAPSAPPSRVVIEDIPRSRLIETPHHQSPLIVGGGPPFADYGRSDLDPLGGFSRNPLGPRGMLIDPNQAIRSQIPFGIGSDFTPGMVPPGSRFDPIGPPMIPGRGAGRQGPFRPDPDHAMPPGFEDMYM